MTISEELRSLAGSWKAFDLSLRNNQGLDEQALAALKTSLEACASAWSNLDSIPRLGANILVDIVPATESNSHLYPGEAGEQITALVYELQELVWKCVEIDESTL
ncbi:MAG: hypothetical protein SYR96_12845 [Actinomycetota bacterium]|nr:hypothetical protein [Actinomycetota bacterium]